MEALVGSVFPARAGMTRGPVRARYAVLSVPRASGDDPVHKDNIVWPNGCSPRERG